MIFSGALRLRVSQETAERLVKADRLAGLSAKLLSRRRMSDAYFDTVRYSFFKLGTTVRIRREGRMQTQTVRRLQPDANETACTTGLSGQSQVPVLGERWAAEHGLRRNASPPNRRIFTADLRQCHFAVANKKSTFKLTTIVGDIHLANPVFKYVAEPVREVELVPVKGSERALFEFALELVESDRASIQPDTIASRGFALASRALQKKHAKAQKVKLDPSMSVGAAFEAIIQSTIGHLLDNQTAALRGDPNGVHQTRVAMRRLRAALRAFKAALPYEGRKAFNGELRWFQQRTGPARDWHVFEDETLARLKPDDVDEAEMKVLRKLAARQGQIHAHEAAQLLQSRRYTRLLLRFARWVAELYETKGDGRLHGPIVPFARKTLAKAHRELLKEIEQVRPGSIEDIHKVRIRGKKVRYAGEFFAALFDEDRAKSYISTVEALQDRLGAANDARVARGLVGELEHGKLTPATIHGLQSWSSRRVSRCVEQARPTLRALRSIDRFWKEP